MGDPATISLVSIGAVALNEGIKFLYGQAGDILKQWRSRQEKAAKTGAPKSEPVEPMTIVLPGVFEGALSNPAIHYNAVEAEEANLIRVFKGLSGYANDIEPVDVGNPGLLRQVAELRGILERIIGEYITFKGENRPGSGTVLRGSVRAALVRGEATGVDLEGQFEGQASGHVETEIVESGGTATGAKWRGGR